MSATTCIHGYMYDNKLIIKIERARKCPSLKSPSHRVSLISSPSPLRNSKGDAGDLFYTGTTEFYCIVKRKAATGIPIVFYDKCLQGFVTCLDA